MMKQKLQYRWHKGNERHYALTLQSTILHKIPRQTSNQTHRTLPNSTQYNRLNIHHGFHNLLPPQPANPPANLEVWVST
jgi:hypothetical protein